MNTPLLRYFFVLLTALLLSASVSLGQDLSSPAGSSGWSMGNLWGSVLDIGTQTFWKATGKKISYFPNKKPQETSTRYYGDWTDRKAPPKKQAVQKPRAVKGITGAVTGSVPVDTIELSVPDKKPRFVGVTGKRVLQTGKTYLLIIEGTHTTGKEILLENGSTEYQVDHIFDAFYEQNDQTINEVLLFNGKKVSQTLPSYPIFQWDLRYRVPYQGDGTFLTVSGTFALGGFVITIFEGCASNADCPSGRVCANSVCTCPQGTTLCGTACINLQKDDQHCGSCDNACPSGSACLDGTCKKDNGLSCDNNEECKSTHCVHNVCRPTDPYCGDDVCDDGERCSAEDASCDGYFANARGACTNGCQLASCSSGFGNCNNDPSDGCETPIRDDNSNCGACNKQCSSGQRCQNGQCVSSCPQGKTACGGRCVDTASDANNCGQCNNQCNAGLSCVSGTCRLTCSTGKTECSGSCVDLSSDSKNCGKCQNICPAGETCQGGTCTLPPCPLGKTRCGSLCVDLGSDGKNCGSCGTACQLNQECMNGKCVNQCSPKETLCDGACADTTKDASHCGRCGNKCQEDEICQESLCKPSTRCSDGKKDGDESDIDCGGSCQTKCGTAKKCLDPAGKSKDENCQDDKCVQGICAEQCGSQYCLPQKGQVCKTISNKVPEKKCVDTCGTETCSTKTQVCDPSTKTCRDKCGKKTICPPNQSCLDNTCKTVPPNSLSLNARCKKDIQCASSACNLFTKRCSNS